MRERMTIQEALKTLELKPPVSEDSLKTAYRNAAKRFHPDRYAAYDRKIWAGEKFIKAKEAYDLLRSVDLQTIHDGLQTDIAGEASRPRQTTVFDNYSDQSDFTERDFIAWLSLWRFCAALFRMLVRPLGGASFTNSSGFQTGLGCLFFLLMLLMIPFGYFVIAPIYTLGICFVFYITFQKVLIAVLEKACGTKIGPESSGIGGHLVYLTILALGAAGAVLFALYVLPAQKNREWIADVITWSFTATLVLTWLLESVLFMKVQFMKRRLTEDLSIALAERRKIAT